MPTFFIPERHRSVTIFTLVYLAIATFFSFWMQNWEFVFYIGVVVVLGIVTLFVNRHVGLSKSIMWLLSLWGLLHMIGGLVPVPDGWPTAGTKPVFYSLWLIPDLLKYDHVIHAYGFGLATWVCWQALKSALSVQVPTPGILILCALGGMGLGGLNEVIEFIATLLIPSTNVGGYVNTGWDLVSNLVGCMVAAFIIWRVRRAQQA